MKKYARVAFNIFFMVMVALITIETFLVVANFEDFAFMIRRQDIMAAGRKVEEEETKTIEKKINEIRKESVKKILTPIAVADIK